MDRSKLYIFELIFIKMQNNIKVFVKIKPQIYKAKNVIV